MKVGIDIHGVIDKYPKYYSNLSHSLVDKGCEVHIVTGSQFKPEILKLLNSFNIRYTHIFSISEYHESIGTEITYIDKNNPMMDEEIWDRTKADYCERRKIDMHFDDSDVYGNYFDSIKTVYVKV